MSAPVEDDVVHLKTADGCKISINGQAHLPCTVHPYARCVTEGCGAEFDNREAMSQHLSETSVRPSNAELLAAGGIMSTGHRAQVVNPTPEERQQQRVRSAISSALDDLYRELDVEVEKGQFTEEEVAKEMRWFDLADGWDEYIEEGG